MLICKKGEKFYIFLASPKCGSSLLQHLILKTTKNFVIHHGNKNIHNCNNNPHDINYNHCSIQGVIKYLQKENIDRDNVVIISTIRNPYTRVISKYYWYLQTHKKKYYKINNDLNKDLKC